MMWVFDIFKFFLIEFDHLGILVFWVCLVLVFKFKDCNLCLFGGSL